MTLSLAHSRDKEGSAPSLRLFIAAALSENVRGRAAAIIKRLPIAPGHIRWIRNENLHLTLKFLGDTAPGKVEEIKTALHPVTRPFAPINIEFKGLGLFPNHERPRVVWIGAHGEVERLQRLEGKISGALETLGVPADERRYEPHLTLGRVKHDQVRGQLARLVREEHETSTGEMTIEEIILFESKLGPAGPVYTEIDTFRLEGMGAP